MIDGPSKPTPERSPKAKTNVRQQSGSEPQFNADADRLLMRRFRDSEYSSITAMMDGKDVAVPKHGSDEDSLIWALNGQCSSACKRNAAHKKYSSDTNRKISKLLDDCGVPNPQE